MGIQSRGIIKIGAIAILIFISGFIIGSLWTTKVYTDISWDILERLQLPDVIYDRIVDYVGGGGRRLG